jgi:acyl-CoA dehydrogenase
MIDFEVPAAAAELRERVRAFVAEVAIPAEPRDRSEHGLDDGLRAELQDRARERGVFGPQAMNRAVAAAAEAS